MQTPKILFIMKQFVSIFLPMLFLSLTGTAQFTANMRNVQSGHTVEYRVYSDLNQYRYETSQDGMNLVIIVKPDQNQTYVILPDQKFIHKTTCDGMMSRMNDPVQSLEAVKEAGEVVSTASVQYEGYDCTKEDIHMNNEPAFTSWFSPGLNFPLKIVNHLADETYMEVSGIQSWDPNPELFSLPGGYTEVDEQMRPVVPEPPAPEKWTEKEFTGTLEGTFHRGERILFTVVSREYHKLSYSNQGEGPAKVVRRIIRNGKELPDNEQGPVKYRTTRLHPGEKKNLTLDWEVGDIIELAVHEGSMQISVSPEK